MNTAGIAATNTSFKHYSHSKSFVRRIVTKHTVKSAGLFGLIVGIYIYIKAESFLTTYATETSRHKLASSLGSNVGIEALLGVAHKIETVGGYAAWNFLCLVAAAGAVWGLLIATKMFRGEEDSGRWELFLSGLTTSRKAATNAIMGLISGLVVMYVFISAFALLIGRLHGSNLTTSACLFFSLSLITGALEFIAVGVIASQLMAVKSRAAGLSAMVFGVFYMIRLVADTTNAHWLLNFSPLGWIEKLQPLYDSQAIWLVPIGLFSATLFGLAIYLAGKRDVGESIFADKDVSKPRTMLLKSPIGLAFRINRAVTLAWVGAIAFAGFVYGLLAKTAAQAISQSTKTEKIIHRLALGGGAVASFMGITFFLIMLLLMYYSISAVGRMREDEAKGYLDNLFVRPISRMRWLLGRLIIIFGSILSAGILGGVAAWIGEASQHGGVSFRTVFLACLNAIVPAVLVVGTCIFALGIKPRLTIVMGYIVIGWSFIVAMLSSGLNLNHWLLDSSILHQVAFAPAVAVNWTSDSIILMIGVVLLTIGALVFNKRDLQGE
jgi:ABC-2 type transport system permease protein